MRLILPRPARPGQGTARPGMAKARGRFGALVLAGFVLGGLVACAPRTDAPVAVAPVAVTQDRLPPLPDPDTCAAAPHAALVGQPGVALERTLILREIRILRDGAAAAGPARPQRINFHLETLPVPEGAAPTRNTTRIVAISCG